MREALLPRPRGRPPWGTAGRARHARGSHCVAHHRVRWAEQALTAATVTFARRLQRKQAGVCSTQARHRIVWGTSRPCTKGSAAEACPAQAGWFTLCAVGAGLAPQGSHLCGSLPVACPQGFQVFEAEVAELHAPRACSAAALVSWRQHEAENASQAGLLAAAACAAAAHVSSRLSHSAGATCAVAAAGVVRAAGGCAAAGAALAALRAHVRSVLRLQARPA